MIKKFILDEQGEPLACEDLVQWAQWFEKANRRVVLSTFDDPESDVTYTISTVFLALDHAHFNGPPILWETMVFRGNEGMWFDRCGGSREQAEAMHVDVAAKLEKKLTKHKKAVPEFNGPEFNAT